MQRDAGFTLVELLLSIVVLGVITAALADAAFVGIRTTADDQTHLQQSNAEQLLANFLGKDVGAACDPSASSPACYNAAHPAQNPAATASPSCSANASFTMDTLSNATAAAYDTTITYTLSSGTLQRVVSGASSSTRTISDGVACLAAFYATSGSCNGQFEVDVTMQGSAPGIGTPQYAFALCAHRRAT
jgi:prepilin-type N-terminal cleavage/methylation domain-containing protein